MPSYKLTYFDLPGRGELTRLLLHYGGIEFEDKRIAFDQWPELKKETPFGQLPVLEIDGEKYTQSIAMSRYIANEVKLAGNSNIENLKIDSLVDVLSDLYEHAIVYAWREKDEAKKKALHDDIVNTIAPSTLGKLDALAEANGGFLALNRLTWADIFFLVIVENVTNYIRQDVFASYPNLQQIKKHVLGIPKIREYFKNRPETENSMLSIFYSLKQDL